MTTATVLAFRPRKVHPDSVKQQPPAPESPGILLVFPTWDPAVDSMLAWAARTDLALFLRWRHETGTGRAPQVGTAGP